MQTSAPDAAQEKIAGLTPPPRPIITIQRFQSSASIHFDMRGFPFQIFILYLLSCAALKLPGCLMPPKPAGRAGAAGPRPAARAGDHR
jgi:hypothetical protein